ncbi:Nucleoporin-like protein 2 [Tieghemiomyces parasiticus]|uniref:Nucleoporin-like protein 2 n=1 Tax=Tieghemiomyces parasiticus TaxID=78921 RepID=A0A9W8A853_9FUNG|nr:Nucleoporin-like protein 2 [Tieghemiomyces parasiticus]
MAICKFFLENRCNKGDACRFEHPRNPPRTQFGSRQPFGNTGGGGSFSGGQNRSGSSFGYDGGYGNQGHDSQPRYSSGQNRHPSNSRQGAEAPARRVGEPTVESIESDMRNHAHMWRYSCYGPENRYPNLIANKDLSPEELQLLYRRCTVEAHREAYRNFLTACDTNVNKAVHRIRSNPQQALRDAKAMFRGEGPSSRTGASAVLSEPLPPFDINNCRHNSTLAGPFTSTTANASAFGPPASAMGQPRPPPSGPFSSATPAFQSAAPLPQSTPWSQQPQPFGANSSSTSAFPAAPAAGNNQWGAGASVPLQGQPGEPVTRSTAPPHEYTPQEIEAFRAERFTLGAIPEFQPPPEFWIA